MCRPRASTCIRWTQTPCSGRCPPSREPHPYMYVSTLAWANGVGSCYVQFLHVCMYALKSNSIPVCVFVRMCLCLCPNATTGSVGISATVTHAHWWGTVPSSSEGGMVTRGSTTSPAWRLMGLGGVWMAARFSSSSPNAQCRVLLLCASVILESCTSDENSILYTNKMTNSKRAATVVPPLHYHQPCHHFVAAVIILHCSPPLLVISS